MNYASLRFHVVEHRDGESLRVHGGNRSVLHLARSLLAMLEAELDGEIEDVGRKDEGRPALADPVLIRLETLQVEISRDGDDVLLRRVAGSEREFDELCELVRDQGMDE